MIRLNRLTDYSLEILRFLSLQDDVSSATMISKACALPVPITSKLLKSLQAAKLVKSTQGHRGGYQLVNPANKIKIIDVIEAIEDGVHLTDCCHKATDCHHFKTCKITNNVQKINHALVTLFQGITLHDLSKSFDISINTNFL